MTPIIVKVEITVIVGHISGTVMRLNICHWLAPSIRAASISSPGMDLSAADSTTTAKPKPIHT